MFEFAVNRIDTLKHDLDVLILKEHTSIKAPSEKERYPHRSLTWPAEYRRPALRLCLWNKVEDSEPPPLSTILDNFFNLANALLETVPDLKLSDDASLLLQVRMFKANIMLIRSLPANDPKEDIITVLELLPRLKSELKQKLSEATTPTISTSCSNEQLELTRRYRLGLN